MSPVLIALAILAFGSVAILLILLVRWIEALLWQRHLVAYEIMLPRKLTHDQVSDWLTALGTATRHIPAVIETRATRGHIEYFILAPEFHAPLLMNQVRTMLPGTRTDLAPDHLSLHWKTRAATELRVTSTSHPLGQERAAAASAALLSALQSLAGGQVVQVSWLIAGTTMPHPAGLVHLASDLARFRRLKQRSLLLRACGRVSVSGAPPKIARAYLYRVYSAMRVLDAPGAALVRRVLPWRVVATRARDRSIPITTWPAILNTRELAGLLGFPIDDVHAPGMLLNAAPQVAPGPDFPRKGLVVAYSNYPGLQERPLALRQADRLRHLWLLGPTGTGKSTLITNLALQDASAGRSFVVVDPKADLCEEILARLPEERLDDVRLLNPAVTDRPIGFNILQAASGSDQVRELVVDDLVRVFGQIWRSSFGPRTADVLRNALLTLTATTAADGTAFTLAEVAPLLENPAFRGFVTSQASVPESVRSFWSTFESMSPGERSQAIGPSLNKLRALTTRTSLRLMLGQSEGLDISDIFTKRRILLVSLNKGVVGSETAQLLGSWVVSWIWNAALHRSRIPSSRRRPVCAYVDEFQDVLRISDDLSDAMSQARALGLELVLANQYLGQLSRPVQAAVLGTVRSSVVFQLDYEDARTLEQRFAPVLTADDLMGLRAFEVAARCSVNGETRPAVTGRTEPLAEPVRDAFSLTKEIRERCGVSRREVEAALRARVAGGQAARQRLGRLQGGAS